MSDTTTDLSVEDRIGLYFRQPNALYRESPHDLLRLAMYELGNKDRRIESLKRENEELKEKLKAAEYDWNEDPDNLTPPLPEGKTIAVLSTAITPEMRERIERKLADMQAESPLPIGGELVDLLRDLLGEQG